MKTKRTHFRFLLAEADHVLIHISGKTRLVDIWTDEKLKTYKTPLMTEVSSGPNPKNAEVPLSSAIKTPPGKIMCGLRTRKTSAAGMAA
jgi:hypothetical protein